MPEKSQQYLQNFNNYLDNRVNLFTHSFHPKIPIEKVRRSVPNDVKLRVLQNQRFNDYLDKISIDKDDRKKKVFAALQILSEMAFNRNMLVIRTLGSIVEKLMAQLYSAVHINQMSIKNLKESMGNQQIIYLPCHRSYVDFMLMSFICFINNIEIPSIAAGMDFYNMKFLGEMMRKTGAFYMRRTFGDEFYWNIFKEYMHEIVTYNDFGLEFFVEGTRSRTCKALWPKLGLLSMSLEPYFMGEVHDLKVVPVSISYEKVLEEQLFVYELLGIPKPKESTKGFFKALTSLKSKSYGHMYFDFGEPISLNKFFGSKVKKFNHSSEPAHIQKMSVDELQLTTDLAQHVLKQQQNKIVIMAYNLIALIYCERIHTNSIESLTFVELQRAVVNLAAFFEELGAIVSVDERDVTKNIQETIALHDNILEVTGSNSKIQLKRANTDSNRTSNGNLKGHWLCKEIMDIVVPVFSLQLYCNPTIYWLSQPAFFVLSTIGQNEVSIDDLKKDVLFLRQIFIYEFVLYPRFEDADFDKILKKLLDMGILIKSSESSVILNEKSPYINLLLSAISPFFSSFFNTSEIILAKFVGMKFVDKDIFIAVQSTLERELLKGNSTIHPYSLCLESMTTTILSLCNSQCLFKEKQNCVNQYSIDEANMSALVHRLRCFNSRWNFNYKYFGNIIVSKI
ncbi:dihydroxyacetone phosphate acyltransferase isoform X2 [Chironomus tepperi]